MYVHIRADLEYVFIAHSFVQKLIQTIYVYVMSICRTVSVKIFLLYVDMISPQAKHICLLICNVYFI